jgi:hypothetical protein
MSWLQELPRTDSRSLRTVASEIDGGVMVSLPIPRSLMKLWREMVSLAMPRLMVYEGSPRSATIVSTEMDGTLILPPLPRASPRTWSTVTGAVILPSPAASRRSPSSEIGRDTVPSGAAPSSRLSRLTGRESVPLGARSLRIVLMLTERSREPGSIRLALSSNCRRRPRTTRRPGCCPAAEVCRSGRLRPRQRYW